MQELEMTHAYIEISGGDHIDIIATGMLDIFAFFARHRRPSAP
jgi:hypothetical protein